MRVGTRQVNHQLRVKPVLQALQRLVQGDQIRLVGTTIRQAHVQVAGFLAKRKILLAMHRQGKHRWVIGKDMRCAIALVHVQIDHRDLQLLALAPPGFGLHQTGRDGDVVEHTKATAFVGVGMVCAPRQIARHTLRQSIAGGGHRGAHRTAGALGHGGAPWETDLTLHRRIQAALGHALDVSGRVHQCQLTIAGGGRFLHLNARQFGTQAVAQAAVLVHGKAMPLGQRQNKVVGVIGVHGLIQNKAILENPL